MPGEEGITPGVYCIGSAWLQKHVTDRVEAQLQGEEDMLGSKWMKWPEKKIRKCSGWERGCP